MIFTRSFSLFVLSLTQWLENLAVRTLEPPEWGSGAAFKNLGSYPGLIK